MRKKFYINKTFRKWLLSYLLVLILPLMMMSIIALHAFSTVKKELTQVYNGTLSQIQTTLDSEFTSIHKITYEIAADSRVQALAYEKSDFSPRQYQTMKQIQTDLQKNLLNCDLAWEIYLYFPATNYMLGSQGHYNLQRIKEHFLSVYGLDYMQYAGLLNSYHFEDLVSFSGDSESQLFLMHSFFPSGFDGGNRALLIVKLDHAELQKQLKMQENDFNSRLELIPEAAAVYDPEKYPFSESDFYQIINSSERVQLNRKNELILSTPSSVQKIHYLLIVQLDALKAETKSIQVLSILCVLFCAVLGVILSWLFSRRQYEPLEKLTRLVREKQKNLDESKNADEYLFLTSSYDRILSDVQRTESELTKREAAVRQMILTRLLLGRFHSDQQVDEWMQNAGMSFSENEFIVISIFVRDDSQLFFEEPEETQDNSDASLLIISNIARELVGGKHKSFDTELDDQYVMIASKSCGEETGKFYRQITSLCEQTIKLCAKHFNLIAFCAVSAVHYNLMGISSGYKEVSEIKEYLLLSDSDTDVTAYPDFLDTAPRAAEEEISLSERCSDFVSLVREGSYTQALRNFDELMEIYLPSDLNNLSLAKCRVFGLIDQLLVAFEDLKKEFSDEFYDQLDPAGHLLQVKTFGELKLEVSRILNEITRYYVEKNPLPPSSRIDQIKDYIYQNYADPNLSASMISERFEMNGAYLSRFFKKQAGCGVLDYIHKVRIREAKRLMSETDRSIRDISEEVGYYNSLTFIRAFKRQEGCTPGQYRDTLK